MHDRHGQAETLNLSHEFPSLMIWSTSVDSGWVNIRKLEAQRPVMMVESKERSRRDSMGGPSQLMRALRTGVVDGGEPGPDWERRKVKSELSLGCDTVRMCVFVKPLSRGCGTVGLSSIRPCIQAHHHHN